MQGDIQDVKHEIALALTSPAFLAVLATVDAEKAVAIATPGPTAVYEGEKATVDSVGYPVCEVIGLQTSYDTVDQQTKSATHELSISWTHVGDDEFAIAAQLERLVRATRDFFWPATGPSPLVALSSWPIVVVSEQYSELQPTREGAFVKGSATVLRVMTETL